ncbi:tetratricopeptide repeat protein [Emcibacter sp.]|uniref:tetratricopeptide repeat protein n=1 Tax=Emcibacter sp. TaxID=1979954 RepID=UPI003A912055
MTSQKQNTHETGLVVRNRGQFNRVLLKGNQLFKKGQYTQAAHFLEAAWKFDNSNSQIAVQIANCLFHIGEKARAIETLIECLEQDPGNADICTVIGGAALKFNFHDIAFKAYEHYTRLKPSDPKGYVNLAAALKEIGQFDKAIDLLQEIIPIYPEYVGLWTSLASVVQLRDGPEASLVFYEEAHRLDSDDRLALYNLSKIHDDLGNRDRAKELAQACVKKFNEFPQAHMLYSKILLNEGILSDGWKEYGWRHHPGSNSSCYLPYKISRWENNADISGKTLLISAEQGVGDELLATPVYDQIIDRAAHVYIGCDPRLVSLFENSFPKATILACTIIQTPDGREGRHYAALEENIAERIDYMCTSLDCLANLWQSVDNIKSRNKILTPAPELVTTWQNRLDSLPSKPNIGICWRSGVLHVQRKIHYADLDDWLPVLKNKNVNFVNIQYGDCKDELKQLEKKHGIIIHNFEDLDLKDDFEGTSAMMSCLDLAMGPTTTPVIQAGLTGTEIWWMSEEHPWWTFGEENPRWLEKGYIHAKKATDKWPVFMKEMANTFNEWVDKKLAGK